MSWFQRLFATAYFVCLVLFATAFVLTPRAFGRWASDFPWWTATYIAGLGLFGLPAVRIVLRDLTRRRLTTEQRRGWAALFFTFWPSLLVYLMWYGWADRERGVDSFGRCE